MILPDNNASERAIRSIKVTTKISGKFKSVKDTQYYALIRSIIDTCIKNVNLYFQFFLTLL
jgi:transposase